MWTCEKNAKARASHFDMLAEGTCRFTDVESFIDSETLKEMKKIGVKGNVQKFKKWFQLAKKGQVGQEGILLTTLEAVLPLVVFAKARLYTSTLS